MNSATVNCVPMSPASDNLKDAAVKWIDKISLKNGSYPPDSYPNPGEISFPVQRSHPGLTFHGSFLSKHSRSTMLSWKLVPSAKNSIRFLLRIPHCQNTIQYIRYARAADNVTMCCSLTACQCTAMNTCTESGRSSQRLET